MMGDPFSLHTHCHMLTKHAEVKMLNLGWIQIFKKNAILFRSSRGTDQETSEVSIRPTCSQRNPPFSSFGFYNSASFFLLKRNCDSNKPLLDSFGNVLTFLYLAQSR